MDRLFEPDEFRSAADSGREPKVSRPRRPLAHILPGEMVTSAGWFVVATTTGPVPGVHRISETLEAGSIITACNIVGRVLQPVAVGSDAYLCGRCQL